MDNFLKLTQGVEETSNVAYDRSKISCDILELLVGAVRDAIDERQKAIDKLRKDLETADQSQLDQLNYGLQLAMKIYRELI